MKELSLKYAGIVFIVVVISCLFHEFGHYITGTLLGNDMVMTLNKTYPQSGNYIELWHHPTVVGLGPIFSIIQAGGSLFLIYKFTSSEWLYAFIITPVTLRVWPYLVSPVMWQDEAFVSSNLGLSPWILTISTWFVLGALAWIGSKKMKVSTKFVFLTVLMVLIFFQIVLRTNNSIVSLL